MTTLVRPAPREDPDRPRTGPDDAIRVARTTAPHKLASAIQQALLRHEACDVVAIGPEATRRAAVGIAIAGGYLAARALSATVRIYLTAMPSSNGDRPLDGILFRVARAPLSP